LTYTRTAGHHIQLGHFSMKIPGHSQRKSTRLDPLVVVTDVAMLARMMENLVDNGLRYGTAVRIRLERFDHSARLIIDSHGPGIPPEQLREVVRPFVGLDTSRNRRRGGTGLGLAIVTQFADLLNVQFSLENRS